MVNYFHGISHKASTILGFSLQDLNNFVSMPSFCCYPKKSITSLVHHSPDTNYYHPVHMTNIQNYTLLSSPKKSPNPKNPANSHILERKRCLYPSLVLLISSLLSALVNLKGCNTFLSKGLNSLKGKNLEFLNPIQSLLGFENIIKSSSV